MFDLLKIIGGAEVGVVAADDHMKVIYVNDQSKEFFKASLGQENFVGRNLTELHNPKSVEKINKLYSEFKNKKRSFYHYTIKKPNGTITIVIVPHYDGDQFTGAMEFIFEGSLG
jgi:DUF438 domain-containing protein